jgi:ectoine hydroxylase-related dioxygenase (phytanoyl-CoA dioxygenase family)
LGGRGLSDHVGAYRAQGFSVVRGVFSADEIAEIAHAFDRFYAQGLSHGRSFRHGNLFYRVVKDAHLGAIVRMAQWPAYVDPVLDLIRTDRRLFALLEPLIGPDIKQIINQMHWKPKGAAHNDFAFHQDCQFRKPASAFRHLGRSFVQTGIAIDRHRPETGAMRVLPGSHKLGDLGLGETMAVMEREMTEQTLLAAGLDPKALIELELEPGDVAFWSPYLVHGSGANRSPNDRRFYINGYVRAADCDRGEWTFRQARPVTLGPKPALVHYEDLYRRPEPHYVDD